MNADRSHFYLNVGSEKAKYILCFAKQKNGS